jgi:ribosome maturation factor RimP
VKQADGKFLARVGDADDDGVELLVDGQLRRVAYADVEHAVIEVEFSEPPAAEIAKLTHEEEESR